VESVATERGSIRVFQLARPCEDRDVVVGRVGKTRPDGGTQLGTLRAEEWIGGLFLGDRRRHRWLSVGAQTLDARELLRDGAIAGLELGGEAQVLLGVLVTAVDPRRIGERRELGERAHHLRRRALEE